MASTSNVVYLDGSNSDDDIPARRARHLYPSCRDKTQQINELNDINDDRDTINRNEAERLHWYNKARDYKERLITATGNYEACIYNIKHFHNMYELHSKNERKNQALRNARLFRAFAVSLSGDTLCKPSISAVCNQCVANLLDFDIDTFEKKEITNHKICIECVAKMCTQCHLKFFGKVMSLG